MTTKEKYREMVIYLLKCDYVDDDEVIESYTDSLMSGVDDLGQEIKELEEALQIINEAFWTDGEPLQERIDDLKSIAKQALNKD